MQLKFQVQEHKLSAASATIVEQLGLALASLPRPSSERPARLALYMLSNNVMPSSLQEHRKKVPADP